MRKRLAVVALCGSVVLIAAPSTPATIQYVAHAQQVSFASDRAPAARYATVDRATRSYVRPAPPRKVKPKLVQPKPKPVQQPVQSVQPKLTPVPVVQLPVTPHGFIAWRTSYAARTVLACESHTNYSEGNGDGAWQIIPSTWREYGGGMYASRASYASSFQQDSVAYRIWRADGWGPWISDWNDGCFQHGGW